jgi:hypothetical protein
LLGALRRTTRRLRNTVLVIPGAQQRVAVSARKPFELITLHGSIVDNRQSCPDAESPGGGTCSGAGMRASPSPGAAPAMATGSSHNHASAVPVYIFWKKPGPAIKYDRAAAFCWQKSTDD